MGFRNYLAKRERVQNPGSRGGTYWKDEYGNVHYGEKPQTDLEWQYHHAVQRARGEGYGWEAFQHPETGKWMTAPNRYFIGGMVGHNLVTDRDDDKAIPHASKERALEFSIRMNT